MNLSKFLRRLPALLACASALLVSATAPAVAAPAVAAPIALSSVDPYARPDSALLVRLPGDMLTRAQACYDLDALMNALLQIHPDIFSVVGQENFLRSYQDIRRALPDTISTAAFYQAVAPLVSMVGDPNTVIISPYGNAPDGSQATEPCSFTVDPVFHTAVMSLRSFPDTPRRMTQFCDSMFSALRADGISNLVIDLSGNTGGIDTRVGDALLRYISPVPFIQIQKVLVNRSPMVLALTDSADSLPDIGLYEAADGDLIRPLTPEEGHFDGRVALIADSITSRSAAALAWAFQHYGMGPVVGKETAGTNICFGDALTWHTPISRIPVAISPKRFWYPGTDETDIHGTIPDIEALGNNPLIDYVWCPLMGIPNTRTPDYNYGVSNSKQFVILELLDRSGGALGRFTDAVYHAPQGDTQVRVIDTTEEQDGILYKFYFDPNTTFNQNVEFTLYIDGRKARYYRPFITHRL